MGLRSVALALQNHALASGALEAPQDPVEGNLTFPFSVCYPANGRIIFEHGVAKRLVTFFLDFHVNRVNLPTDFQTLAGFIEAFVPRLLNDPTLGGTVSTVLAESGAPITYSVGAMNYASVETLGVRFEITVKMQE